jgi:hypothetical protein
MRPEIGPGHRAVEIALCVALAFVIADVIATPQAPASCSTDTECAALCPANEPDCDGGPAD